MRHRIGWMVAALVAVFTCGPALAQSAAVPRLVRIVVPFSPGASNDVIARAVAASLSRRLDTNVIVENKAGAAGVIGADAVAKSPKDGSVLLLTSSTFLTSAATQPQLPYDPIAAFAPVAMIGQGPLVLAVPASAAYKSPADVIAASKARPKALNYGTAGVGSVGHLATELLADAAGVQWVHVPYKGAANAALDLASGQIELMLSSYSTLQSLVKAGRVRALAVTSDKPHPAFPELPALASAVPNYAIEIWVGVFAPSGTPSELVERYNRELVEIAASPELAPILEPEGTVPSRLSASAFAARVADELGRWKRIAVERKIVAE